jgi:CheY-like chemotaxis protein
MDHMMPVMDGIKTTEAIRAMGAPFDTLPIIALSANAIVGVKELFMGAGMNDFLPKPILIKELHHMLLTYLPEDKIVKPPVP